MLGESREVPPMLFLNDLVRDVGGTFGDAGGISRGCRGNLGNLRKVFLRISYGMPVGCRGNLSRGMPGEPSGMPGEPRGNPGGTSASHFLRIS